MEGYGGLANQIGAEVGYDVPKSIRRMTIREELNNQVAGLESMLKNKKAMLQLLDENPVIEKFMDLSRQG